MAHSPNEAFNSLHYCFIGDSLLPSDSQDSSKAMHVICHNPFLDLITESPNVQLYSAIEVTSGLIIFTLLHVETLLVFHRFFSFASCLVFMANLFFTSVSDVMSLVLVLPRY